MELDLVIRAAVLPATAIAVALALLVRAAHLAFGSRSVAAVAALAPMAVTLAAFRALAVQEGEHFLAGLAPAVCYGWLPSAMLLGAATAAAVGAGGSPLSAGLSAVAAPVAAFGLLAPPGFRGGEPQAIAAALTAAAACSSLPALRGLPRGGYFAWWLTLSAASAMPIVAGFAKLGFVAASLAATVAAIGVLAWLRLGVAFGSAMHVTLCTALGGVAFVGMGYDEAPLPRWCWAAVGIAPAASVVSVLLPASMPRRVRDAVAVIAPASIVAAALVVALAAAAPGATDDHGYARAAPRAGTP